MAPRTGQITKVPYPRLEMVDSTRVDEKFRLTREQIGPPVLIGQSRGRYLKTLAVEIQYKTDRQPYMVFRLDSWECRKVDGGREYRRISYMKLTMRAAVDLVKSLGGGRGQASPGVVEGLRALKEARVAYHERRLAALAELERKPSQEPAQPAQDSFIDVSDLENMA